LSSIAFNLEVLDKTHFSFDFLKVKLTADLSEFEQVVEETKEQEEED
jgi:hypothetical protein